MSDGTRAQMSFGQAPQEPFDQDNGITPKYGINAKGQIVDLADGRIIEDMDREMTLQRELAASRLEEKLRHDKREMKASRIARMIILEDFKHFEDVPASSRSSIGKEELFQALKRAALDAWTKADRDEDIEADGM